MPAGSDDLLICAAKAEFEVAGWSCSAHTLQTAGRTIWLMTAEKGQLKIVGRGTQDCDAWQAALAQLRGLGSA